MPSRGYRSEAYARAVSPDGSVIALERAGGWLVPRPVDGRRDAMGPYPLFCCRDWAALDADLTALAGDLLSVVVVTDPFGDHDEAVLHAAFPDRVVPFKEHHVAHLSERPERFVHAKHRYSARKALEVVRVERCADPLEHLDEWDDLYRGLIDQHQITGPAAFSRASFEQQLAVPGMVAFRALDGADTVAMALCYEDGEHAYYHLSATSPRGRAVYATHGILWTVLHDLADAGVERFDLGAAPSEGDRAGSLDTFKRRWANECVPVHLCGRVLDRDGYDAAVRRAGSEGSSWFPAYRAPGRGDA